MAQQLDILSDDTPPDELQPDVRFAIALAPLFTLLPFAGFLDTVRHAADEADKSRQRYCRWQVVAETLQPVPSSCGSQVLPDATFGSLRPQAVDYLVVHAGLMAGLEQVTPAFYDFLRRMAGADVTLVGLDSGTFLLAAAGLMNGRVCAVHWRHREQFARTFPHVRAVTNELYVLDGNRITCPGGTSAIDLAVELLTLHCGRARALKGLADLHVDEQRGMHHVLRSFQQIHTADLDSRLARAVSFMQENLSTHYPLAAVGKKVGVSTRQLTRLFRERFDQSPAEYWRERRLQHARWRILNTSRPLNAIAHECGFTDNAHFTRWFKRRFGETPSRHRELRNVRVSGTPA